MKCKMQIKTTENDRGIWEARIWSHRSAFLSWAWDIVYTKGDFEAALWHHG